MRRAVKISAWTVGGLLILSVALFAALLVAGNTESGRALIERLTARLTSGEVQLSGISGSFPASIDLASLQLSDEKGVWLTAERISLRWTPSALLFRHVVVDSLRVGKLHIERAPIPKPKKHKTETSIPHTDLSLLSVDTLELGPQLAGAPTSLVVTGNAHVRSMQDARAIVDARRTNGDGEYHLQLAFDPARMDATLKLQEPAGGPLENLIDLPGLGALSALVSVAGPRSGERVELSIDAGPLRARARGTVNITAQSGDFDYSLEAPAMTPAPGLAWQKLFLQGKYSGPVTAPVADGRLQVDALQAPGGVQLASLSANLTAAAGKLAAHATIEQLVIPGSQPRILQDSPITIEAAMLLKDPSRPLSMTASHRLFALRARAVTAGKQQSADIELRLPDIAPLAAIGSQDVKGSANIKGRMTHSSDTTHLDVEASAALSGGAPLFARVLGQSTRLQLEGEMSEAAFQIERLQLTGRALTASVTGTASRSESQDLSARWDLKLSDLAALSPTASGTLSLGGRLKGPAKDLTADANLSSTLSIRGSPPGSVTATLHAEGLPTAPRGTIEAHGMLDGAPLRVYASLERDNGKQLHGVIRQGDWKSTHLEGELSSDAQMAQARGEFRLRMGDLGDLQRLLGTNLRGHVAGTLALHPVRDRTQLQLQIDAGDLVMGTVAGSLQLAAQGSTDALDMKLGAQFPNLGGQSLTLNVASTVNVSAHELRLTSAESGYHGQTIHLLAPATISFADGVTVSDLRIGAQQAVLEAQGRVSPTLDLHASLRQVGPELVNAFVPDLLAKGLIEGDAAIQGSTAAPNGHVMLEATGLRSTNEAAHGLPLVDVEAGAQLNGGVATLDVRLKAGPTSHLALTGPAPLNPEGGINVKLAGALDLTLLNPFLEVHGQHATGQLIVDTAITGVAKEPDIGGTVKLERGNLRDYAHGVNLTNIAGEFVGGHGILTIDHLTARAVSGDVSVSGTIGVLQPKIPLDLKLTAKNAQPIASNLITANIDADLRATGTAREHVDVSGTIGVNRADIQIPNSLPPNVAVLDVRRPGQAPPPPSEKPLIIALSVTVRAPRQILVRGRGLDSELGGELRIRGTTDDPRVSGGFELQRGTFSLASTRLTFNQGTVTFNGSGLKDKIDPTLDFTAQSQVADTTVTLRITGLADAPRIELSSSPDLPQDEIMARLLFGTTASQLSALQAAQIGAALASLGGGGGGLNPLAKIQKTLGLDRLSVGGGSSNSNTPGSQNQGATIEAGRYVSSRVFVAVKQTTTGSSQLAVDVDLSKHLKLQTRLGNGSATAQGTTPENDPGSSIGLGYQFEY